MRKEVIWAIGAGILFGLVIAYGVVRINSALKPKGEKAEASPTPAGITSEFKITLDKPENEDVVTEGSVTLSGITKPQVLVTVSGEDGDYILKADEKGAFEEEVELIPGVNQIKITAFDPDRIGVDPTGAQSIEKVLIVYSSSFEKKTTEEPKTEGATSESDIRLKVQQKVADALNKPKAYLGTVTDIADSTIQVKTAGGEIRQISANKDEVAVVKTGTTNKIVKFTDIAIGDFIVAMGYKNENQVLDTQRILITPPVTEPKITATFGKGADVTPTKTTLVFLFKEGKVTKAKATSIQDQSQVIYITTEVGGKSGVRSIFIIS